MGFLSAFRSVDASPPPSSIPSGPIADSEDLRFIAETKEQVAGFDVVECTDLDEAIEVACRHPMARLGVLEVRPFRPLGEE